MVTMVVAVEGREERRWLMFGRGGRNGVWGELSRTSGFGGRSLEFALGFSMQQKG